MATLVLTVIGDDRSGLVSALADVVAAHDGNWERSELSELAGKFAGIVVAAVPDDRVDAFVAAVTPLSGLLEVSVHTGQLVEAASGQPGVEDADSRTLSVEIVGNDRPGIVREVSSVLARHGVSIDRLSTRTTEAPWNGGMLFEAQVDAKVPSDADPDAVRADLERLADELMVDISLDAGRGSSVDGQPEPPRTPASSLGRATRDQ